MRLVLHRKRNEKNHFLNVKFAKTTNEKLTRRVYRLLPMTTDQLTPCVSFAALERKQNRVRSLASEVRNI